MTDILRKASQEIEIDHLLAEEFECDPGFGARFLAACGIRADGFEIERTLPEPSFSGDGFGDLLVEGRIDGQRIALLIEDKITAGAATRQAERYREHAGRLRDAGWDAVHCILVAPAAYRGERAQYDASIDLETVAELLRSPEPKRLTFRRGIIERALEKRASTGVRVPDEKMLTLKSAYLQFAAEWCDREGVPFSFPRLMESYYDGDNWIDEVRHPAFPAHVRLRHRMWTSVSHRTGLVDLIASPATEDERYRFEAEPPPGAVVFPFSRGKGIQVSIPVEEMRQEKGFDPDTASAVLNHMLRLAQWYWTDPR